MIFNICLAVAAVGFLLMLPLLFVGAWQELKKVAEWFMLDPLGSTYIVGACLLMIGLFLWALLVGLRNEEKERQEKLNLKTTIEQLQNQEQHNGKEAVDGLPDRSPNL